jgi:hypothetical protein
LVENNEGAAIGLADALLGAGRPREARRELEEFLKRPEEYPLVRLRLAELLVMDVGSETYDPKAALRQVLHVERTMSAFQHTQLRAMAIVLSHNGEFEGAWQRARAGEAIAPETALAEMTEIRQSIERKQAYRPTKP